MSYRKFSLTDWNNRHFKRVEDYAHRVQVIMYTAIQEAIHIALASKPDSESEFSFERFPRTREQISELFQRLSVNIILTIQNGHKAQWDFANTKNDAFVESVFAGIKAVKELNLPPRYNNRNEEARAAFQTRRVGGLNLSERVFKYTGQLRTELELAIDLGIGDGKSATQISRDVRQYLNEPDRLFRRVRNKRGQLALSKAASVYKPGTGIYRSSYKNAMRLVRTELNMAYREADHLRYQQLEFVVGFEVHRSNNTIGCDVCESLKGRYPKDFKFVGWHSNCRCHVVSILATRDELRKLTDKILNNESTGAFKSENEVIAVNPEFEEWLAKNKDRLLNAKSLPYFLTDNMKYLNQQIL